MDEKPKPRPRLRAVKEAGTSEIDATTLHGIPAAAWDYKLGNRSGLEWMLDQWKKHKFSYPAVAERFNPLPLRRPQGARDRPAGPRLQGKRGDDEDRARDAVKLVGWPLRVWRLDISGAAQS